MVSKSPRRNQPEEEKPLTLEDVRAVCADKSSAKALRQKLRQSSTKHGADKLSEVDLAECALLAEVEVLGNAG